MRLSDADPSGRLRFDAVARYLHDVSNDDTRDSGLRDDGSWVVRRTSLVVAGRAPRFLETVGWRRGAAARAAGGPSAGCRSWALGAGGVEATSLWVYVDLASMMPKRLGADFLALYGAGGRRSDRRVEAGAPGGRTRQAARRPWPLRRTDLDVLDHVNNAAYWAAVEEVVGGASGARRRPRTGPSSSTPSPSTAGADVELVVANERRRP